LRDGQAAPEGHNVIFITRTYIEPRPHSAEESPLAPDLQPEPAAEPSEPQQRPMPLDYPPLGLA
jgi:hypothetical protein